MRVTVRLPAALHQALERQSEADLRSLNAEIIYLLTRALQQTQDRRADS